MSARQSRGGLGPSAEQTWLEHELPQYLTAAQGRRLENYERRHVELLSDVQVRAVDDERGTARTLYRHDDGRLFETLPLVREAGSRPDAALVCWEPWHVTELALVDLEHYEVEAARHRAEVERAEAERIAAEAAVEQARRDAPEQVLAGPDTWTMPELLEQLERTAGTITLHDDRALVTLPASPHLLGQPHAYRLAVDHLRPLLVASRLGTVTVTCDLEHCDADAATVASGGAYLCEQHRR